MTYTELFELSETLEGLQEGDFVYSTDRFQSPFLQGRVLEVVKYVRSPVRPYPNLPTPPIAAIIEWSAKGEITKRTIEHYGSAGVKEIHLLSRPSDEEAGAKGVLKRVRGNFSLNWVLNS